MFDQDPNEGLIDREEYEKWETMQHTTTVIQAACKDLKKLAFLIETNPGYVIKDTLWFSDVETVADAITRVSIEIDDLLTNAKADRAGDPKPDQTQTSTIPGSASGDLLGLISNKQELKP